MAGRQKFDQEVLLFDITCLLSRIRFIRIKGQGSRGAARTKRIDHVPSAKYCTKMEGEAEDKMEADLGDRDSDDDSSSNESESELQQQVEQLQENVCYETDPQ